jgi:hypothetical protein
MMAISAAAAVTILCEKIQSTARHRKNDAIDGLCFSDAAPPALDWQVTVANVFGPANRYLANKNLDRRAKPPAWRGLD